MAPRTFTFILAGALAGVAPGLRFSGIAVPPGGRHAWAVRSDTVLVYRTSDFGLTWQQRGLQSIRAPMDVEFVDSLHGWTCGVVGDIWHTGDGGDSWYRQNLGGLMAAYRIRLADSLRGWVAGNESFLMYTTDGGASWPYDYLGLVVPMYTTFSGLDFGHDSLWLCATRDYGDTSRPGGGRVVMRPAGGDSWVQVRRDSARDFYDIRLVAGSGVVVVGVDTSGRGTVLRRAAGGEWAEASIVPGPVPALRSVDFVDGIHGWACGDSGTVISTADGGWTWLRQPVPTGRNLDDIDFCDQWRGMAGGDGVLLVTEDGGVDWRDVTPVGGVTGEPAPAPTPLVTPRVTRGRVLAPGGCAVYDAQGRLAARGDAAGADLSRLPPGVYTVVFPAGGTRSGGRVVRVE